MRSVVTRIRAASFLTLVLLAAAACSPGTLPGTPSALTVGGGGGRYNGTITTRRIGGMATILPKPGVWLQRPMPHDLCHSSPP